MNKLFRSSFAVTTVTLALVASSFASPNSEPGYVDISPFMASAKGEFVEVNLSGSLIRFAARIAKTQEPEVAELLGNLKSIRVNVVGLDDRNRTDTLEKIEAIRRQLETKGWTKVVTVREKNNGDNVDVHMRQQGDDIIQGLVVTVIDKKGEAVFVNIVGNISADKIAELAEKLNIEPLRKLKGRVSKN